MDTLSLYASAATLPSTTPHKFEQSAPLEPSYGPVQDAPLPEFELAQEPEPIIEHEPEPIARHEVEDERLAPVEYAPIEASAEPTDTAGFAEAPYVEAEAIDEAEPVAVAQPAASYDAAPGWVAEYDSSGTWEPAVEQEPAVAYEPAVADGPLPLAEAATPTAPTHSFEAPETPDGEDGWVQEIVPLEMLEFAERRVIVRLVTGETLDVATAGSATEAVEGAKEVVRRIATAEESGEWPELAGRFVRPDTIVSVDVQVAG